MTRRSPVEAVRAAYARIEEVDDPGIFIHLVPIADALAAAERVPADAPLAGHTFAVKDNIDVAGLPTTAACREFAYTAEATAPAVQRLLDAGAVLIGKTNLDQFATGLVGVRTPWPVPRNACDPTLVPGGSSSGSAVAVAQGIVDIALGTDTAGSGRVPAGLNGIVGLKPSPGAVPTRGVVPACRTLDCVSVFARDVHTAWAGYAAMAGYDAADPWSRPVRADAWGLPPGLRIGVPRQADRLFFGDEQAAAAFETHLAALGMPLVEIDMTPFYETAALLYGGAWVAERYAAIRTLIEANPEALLPVTRTIIGGATRLSAADAFDGLYRLAELRRVATGVWNGIDVLCVPTLPRAYTLDEVAADPIGTNSKLGTYTNFVNLLDLCALAVPGALRGDGRPAGVTFIAPWGRDGLLAALGETFTTGRVPTATTPTDGIEIAVVGAHLSGMPLNHQLTSLGGSFVRAVTTTPDYRLYALPGGPPERPGLVRVEPGAGASIATEVWSLPAEGFARFVAGIPAPLGIGTLRLADGTTPKGFLCEALATRDAQDITGFGGWRAYVASRAA
ncbi:MAG: allophanate hydrolase [Geminicoccaceae bacterium]